MKKISFILPSRSNLKYLKWAYDAIRKNTSPDHEICMYDDFSNDGTWDWMQDILDKDPNVQIFRNEGPHRLGHTILYDRLIETSSNDIVMIFHADMWLVPGSIEAVLDVIKPKTVVSMTRIEPSLHPPGPEKILSDFGTEPEDFDEKKFLKFVSDVKPQYSNTRTEGMFAPWAIYKEDFLAIGGHDPLYAPQSREDSDIFNRFLLAGYEPIQLWNAFVYHMTCRGSRFNPQLTQVGQASPEWLAHNRKSERNFTRKWGHMVKVDENLKPIIPHKYDITFVVRNCNDNILDALEPWCSRIYCDDHNNEYIERYIKSEQQNTMYDLSKRVLPIRQNPLFPEGDVIVEFDGSQLTQQRFQDVVIQLSSILDQVNEPGEYEFDIFNVNIRKINHYESDLIVVDKEKTVR